MWKAFVFGAVVAGAIGPIALLVFGTAARRGIRRRRVRGTRRGAADFLYALAAFLIGALVMPLVAAHENPLRSACALLLIGLGAAMLFGSRGGGRRSCRSLPQALMPTFLLTIVNPMTIVVFAGIVPQLPVAGSFAKAAALALALAAGARLSSLRSRDRRRARTGDAGEERQARVTAAAAAGIVAFGIYGLASAF
jgi:putative LysE/RhtB family amino acid efflux pump